MRKNISKICKKNFVFPEIMGDLVRPEIKKFSTGCQNFFFEKLIKNCLKSPIQNRLFSLFNIASPDGGRGLWSLISGDDVITGSGPNQKNFIDFGVSGPTEFSSELCFVVRFTGLRFARPYRRPKYSSISSYEKLCHGMNYACWTGFSQTEDGPLPVVG